MAKRTHNSDELFELKWNNYSHSITEEIYNLRQNDLLVDLTFCCEGVTIGEFCINFCVLVVLMNARLAGCHKLLIFACSPVLRKVLTQNPSPHPIIYVTDIKLPILKAILKYIYQGEVQISKSELVSFMKAADSFQIRGLQSKRSLNEITSATDVKKRRTYDTGGPGTSSSGFEPTQTTDNDGSNLDFSEFENECSFGGNDGSESMDDTRTGTITVQKAVQKLKKYINSIESGVEILNEYQQTGALNDEKREGLCQILAEFMAKGIVRGGRAGHEVISEATMILFPGVFKEDPVSKLSQIFENTN